MKMERVMIQLPLSLKRKLDELRTQGYSMAGFIRAAVEDKLNQQLTGKKRR